MRAQIIHSKKIPFLTFSNEWLEFHRNNASWMACLMHCLPEKWPRLIYFRPSANESDRLSHRGDYLSQGNCVKDLELTLRCCGTNIQMTLDEAAIIARSPNEIRKNVGCPGCRKLVILSFERIGNDITNAEQEVIEV